MNKNIDIPDNDSILWHGTRFGFKPELPDAIKVILNDNDIEKSRLLPALLNEKKFVAAHVILTLMDNNGYEEFPTWNKLKIEIDSNGKVHIPEEQRSFLEEYWRNRVK